MKHPTFNWLAVAIYTGVIAWMSMSSTLPSMTPHFFEGEDKLAHVGMYGLHAILLVRAIRMHTRPTAAGWSAFLLSSLYGVAMEFAQDAWSAGTRAFSTGDMLANAIGAAAGIIAFRFMLRKD